MTFSGKETSTETIPAPSPEGTNQVLEQVQRRNRWDMLGYCSIFLEVPIIVYNCMYMYFWPILTYVLMVMFHVLLGCDPPNMAMSPVNRLTRTNNKHKLQWSIRYLHRVTTFQSTENGKQTAMLVLFAISHGYWHTIWGTNRGAVYLPRCSFQSPFFVVFRIVFFVTSQSVFSPSVSVRQAGRAPSKEWAKKG